MLAQRHLSRLNPEERRRFIALERQCRGRPSHLSDAERAELSALIAKMEPRRFAGLAADAFSPVPLPGMRQYYVLNHSTSVFGEL